tara:strand:+ start:257 stop:697 length:441 start_codon:yes stop_codon:yes gene_type:complete
MKIDIVKAIDDYVEELTMNYTKELTKEIVKGTPVWSGELASKWSLGINNKAPSVAGKTYNGDDERQPANENTVHEEQINRLSSLAKGVNIGGEINISNDSDHSVDIEFNTPNAPKSGGQRHMIRRAVNNSDAILKRAEKLTKDIKL